MQKADPGARRRAVWLVVVAAVAGAGLLFFLQHSAERSESLAKTDPELAMERIRLVLSLLAGALVVTMLAMTAYLYRFGARIQAAMQFPPPGARVLRDTPVVGGSRAISRGRLLKFLAIVLGLVTVAAAALLLLIAQLSGQGLD